MKEDNMKEDKLIHFKKEQCVMCGNPAAVKVYENNEALCEPCFRNNLEARQRKR
jgi:hypothetical protein